MKLSFDSNLQFQKDAIEAITDIFEGQPIDDSNIAIQFEFSETLPGINGNPNSLVLEENQILENLNKVQKRNDLKLSESLDGMNFSVEMETGTGKTYVYLRTVYELNKLYGFQKFVITVPSIAIREGVLKNLQITHEHLQSLYDNVPINFRVFNSSKLSELRGFATNNNIEILVINIDSFSKDSNKINTENDKITGMKPIEFIKSTNPIVIVDEPQNFETEIRKNALKELNPLCTLRYSATHKNYYNLAYSLNPVKAYDLGLVKQIEVDSIFEQDSFNEAYLRLDSVQSAKTKVTANVTIDISTNSSVVRKKIVVKAGDDLFDLSKRREVYSSGFTIQELDVTNQTVTLQNGTIIKKGESQGGMNEELMKVQIQKTIEEHFNKELKLNKLGIKVLSLFFIDKVSNYRSYDSSGNVVDGKFILWFEELYKLITSKPKYSGIRFSARESHEGYFSQDKGKIKDTNGGTIADDYTYNLIMKDKEKLLGLENPLRFIFSHSALREGWDNPNVFQICTLNETKSDIKKRQEIGRGLRLCVNQKGERIFEKETNKLTIVANESYNEFAKALQNEIETDCGVEFKNRVKNIRDKTIVKYRKGFTLDPLFLEIWKKINLRTSYSVNFDTVKLINICAESIKQLPKTKPPSIKSTKAKIVIDNSEISATLVNDALPEVVEYQGRIPDVLGYLVSKTELTRSTIFQILEKSNRLHDIAINPQSFLDALIGEINKCLNQLMIDGIKYEKIGNAIYEMKLFEDRDMEIYKNENTFVVSDRSKTIYENLIPLDSKIENQFAKDCESSNQVKFYFKLPFWFKIDTPLGSYNPDWAVVFEDDKKIYFVIETKSTTDQSELRPEEQMKIECGKAHFKEFENVTYKTTNKVTGLRD